MTSLNLRNSAGTGWTRYGALTVTPPTEPGPDPTPEPVAGQILPSKVVGVYGYIWSGPTQAQINALSASRRPNLVSWAVAQSGGSGTGLVSFSGSGRVDKASNDAAVALGITPVLLIGGAGDGGITLHNSTQRDQMIASLKSIIDAYGFRGIDWDIESSTSWTPSVAVEVSQALRDQYGPSFVIAYSPRPYEIRSSSGIGYQFVVALGSLLECAFAQFYDADAWKDDAFLKSQSKKDFAPLLAAGVPASRLGIGCITLSSYSMGWNDAGTYLQAFKEIEAYEPGLRGTQMWHAGYALADDWTYTRTMNAGIRGVS